MKTNAYTNLEERAFWAPSVGRRNMFDIRDLWRPRFQICANDSVATFGSCFAQHFSRALTARGFTWFNAEPMPWKLPPELARAFNYGIFSARTGNIYTPSLLLQWTRWALGDAPPEEVWTENGRFYDPFRPSIEPDGFASIEEMRRSRVQCLRAFRRCIDEVAVFVFTLGLTESWWAAGHSWEYPVCPGVAAGDFDPSQHSFVNQDYKATLESLTASILLMRTRNPDLRFLLTVSPVPLTATRSGEHVLVATSASKAVLRAAAGAAAATIEGVDYFPSYEIISAPPFRAAFFEPNQRNVNPQGVEHVMDCFFEGLGGARKRLGTMSAPAPNKASRRSRAPYAPVCDEELLAAFGPEQP